MAGPPFDVAQAVPGDSDTVSQFPAAERTMRDIIESWLLINHNTSGRHDEVALDHKADPAAPGAGITEVWASNTGTAAGKLKMRNGTGNVEYIGFWPGDIKPSARAAEHEGWLFANGQAVSRTTYADLFAAIGTTYGAGDGSTTFNVPDINGRVIAGDDNAGGLNRNRLTTGAGGFDGDVVGSAGGEETHVLTIAELPTITPAGTIPDHFHFLAGTTGATAPTPALDATNYLTPQLFGVGSIDYQFRGHTEVPSVGKTSDKSSVFTGTPFGSGTAHNNMQPTLVLNYFIKT